MTRISHRYELTDEQWLQIIEYYFNKLKYFRPIATRFEKFAESFLAFVHVVTTFIRTKQFEDTS